MDFNLVEMKSQTNQPSLAKPASGVKEFIKTLTGISQKIKLSEFNIIGEYRENEFIPGSYNFTIKGLYEVDNHRAIPFPEGYSKKCYCLSREQPSDDLYIDDTDSYWKCYRFVANPISLKVDTDAMSDIRVHTLEGKYGLFNSYFWDTTIDESEIAKIGDIKF